jgi:hypothetical protein
VITLKACERRGERGRKLEAERQARETMRSLSFGSRARRLRTASIVLSLLKPAFTTVFREWGRIEEARDEWKEICAEFRVFKACPVSKRSTPSPPPCLHAAEVPM